MDALFLDSLLAIAEQCLIKISNDESLKQSILDKCQSADDWLQVKLGQVNKRTLRDAIELAVNTSIVRDEETICAIIATVSTLYACGQVERGADVGGTLLQKFGQETFPHIDIRELRFAKPINETIYNLCMEEAKEKFSETMKSYDFKRLSTDEIKNTWAGTTCLGVHGTAWLAIHHGADIIKYLRKILDFFAIKNPH